MTKDETREAIKVMQAYVDGSEIEIKGDYDGDDAWECGEEPEWDFISNNYRIKPEPREWWIDRNTYQAYANREFVPGSAYNDAIKVQEIIE
jgi:hypothetical protein